MTAQNFHLSLDLTDINGVSLPHNSDDPEFQYITTTGAETKYFYLDWEGKIAFNLANIRITTSSAVILDAIVQGYVNGSWREIPAYATGTLTTAQAQQLNTLYPLIEIIPRKTKIRLAATVDGITTILVNASTS